MEYGIVDSLPSAEDYNRLREAVGWGGYERNIIEAALPRSLYGVCAVADGRTVGMARIVGDGGLVYYVQDVIVHPAWRRRGIGRQLMERVMAYLRGHACANAVVGLMAARGKERFYERYGFTARPNERLGAGMTIFWRPEL